MRLPSSVRVAFLLLSISTPLVAAAQPLTNLWRFSMPDNAFGSSPAIAADGTIYLGTFRGFLVAVSPEGRQKWIFRASREIKSSPAIGEDGTIYFGSRDGKFYAVSPLGKLKWAFPTGAWVDSSPAIGEDGTIYFGSHDKKFYALNPSGAKKWAFTADGPIASSPAIGADGTIYFNSTDGLLYALRPDGTERWRVPVGGVSAASPVLDGHGMIYLATDAGTTGVSEAGKKIWDMPVARSLDSAPVIMPDRLVLCPAPWRDFIAQTPDGGFVWRVGLDSDFKTSPTLGENGVIYVAGGPYLMALVLTNEPATSPAQHAWPIFHANPRHTGRVNPD